jgi:CheY-like chemotaxis protein
VAKILVADDNSNIQKMVALALKDQGIDVVAVGNGEAAVRKIAEIRPDLVLADVFMPVRNGYEVCEFVKADRKLSHIPVILLVGAFDPLDEQEAQRVGADGVLKKPFVPPDPLISMVQSALSRAGVATREGTAPAAPLESPATIHGFDTPVLASIPIPAAEPGEQLPSDFRSTSQRVTIPEGSQPLAFGNLLESLNEKTSQAVSPEEEDPNFLVERHPQLDEERAWNAPPTEADAATEEEEEAEHHADWRRDGGDESLGAEIPAATVRDWRDTAFATAPESAQTEPTQVAQQTAPPAAETSKGSAPGAAFADDGWASATKGAAEHWASASHGAVGPAAADGMVSHAEAPRGTETSAHESSPTASTEPPPAKEEKPNSWFSVPSNPWDAEARKASQLAKTWNVTPAHAVVADVVESSKSIEAEPRASDFAQSNPAYTEPAAVFGAGKPEVSESAEKAATEVAPMPSIKDEAAPKPEPAKAEEPSTASASNTDEMVAKVLAKMTPEVLQAVTREILKPVVEAIVRDELEQKK